MCKKRPNSTVSIRIGLSVVVHVTVVRIHVPSIIRRIPRTRPTPVAINSTNLPYSLWINY